MVIYDIKKYKWQDILEKRLDVTCVVSCRSSFLLPWLCRTMVLSVRLFVVKNRVWGKMCKEIRLVADRMTASRECARLPGKGLAD